MEARMTREELLERIFSGRYEELKGKQLRMVRVRVPGREVSLAHVIGRSYPRIYENLALNIGVHEGEDHTGEAIGIMRLNPWEVVVAAADIATKAGDVQISFMDRFCGTLIVTGELSQVRSSVKEVLRFFRELGFPTCKFTEQ